jgi:transcriptional regulator with XRE-family HTH domain
MVRIVVSHAREANMNPDEFKAALKVLGWNQSEFGRKAALTPATVSRYATGENEIPAWVDKYLGLTLEVKRLYAAYVAPEPRTSTRNDP